MNVRRRDFLKGAVASTLITKPANAWKHGVAGGSTPFGWYDLKIGGGGFCTGIDVANDGTLVTRVDVFGAYLGKTTPGAVWSQLITAASMPTPASTAPYWNEGVDEIRIAPSNSQVIYMRYIGANGDSRFGWFVSTNQGATWTLIPGTASNWEANSQTTRTWGQKGCVDPANSNVAYLSGVGAAGVQVTTNGGTSVSTISTATIPLPTSGFGGYGWCFDPTSGTTGGKTNRILLPIYGTGVYISANAGSTWGLSSGSPSEIVYGQCSPVDGTYACIDGSFNVWNLVGATWTKILSSGVVGGLSNIAWDPVTVGRLVVTTGAGLPQVATAANTTSPSWTTNSASAGLTISSSIVPWQQNEGISYMSAGGMVFDPSVSNRLWLGCGTGVFYCTGINVGISPPQTWIGQIAGIENLVANDVCWPPSGDPILVAEDKPYWQITNPNAYPPNYGPNYSAAIRFGAAADWAKSSPTNVAGVDSASANGATQISLNSSGGAYNSWTSVASQPTAQGPGGCIAALTPNNLCFVDFVGNNVYVTANGGGSWTSPASLPANQWNASSFVCRHIVVADDTTTGTYYIYAYNGIWSSSNSGATWTQVGTSALAPTADGFSACMRQAPGKAGHLFWTPGPQGTATSTHPVTGAAGTFQWNSAGGATASWADVSNSSYTIREVISFGFSKPKPGGGGYPAILIVGWVNGTFGIWQCDTFDTPSTAVWYQIGTFPLNIDLVKIVGGSPNNWGEWIVGGPGTSWRYYGPGTVSQNDNRPSWRARLARLFNRKRAA